MAGLVRQELLMATSALRPESVPVMNASSGLLIPTDSASGNDRYFFHPGKNNYLLFQKNHLLGAEYDQIGKNGVLTSSCIWPFFDAAA